MCIGVWDAVRCYVLPVKTRFPKTRTRLSKPCIPCKLIKAHWSWTRFINKNQDRHPIRNIDLGLTCSCSTSLGNIYWDLVAYHMAFHFKPLFRSHIVSHGLFYALYCILCQIIMAHLWLSLLGIISHIIWYCISGTYCDIILYYTAYNIWTCCIINGTVVASHVLGYYSSDIIIIVGSIIFYCGWLLFSSITAYDVVL